MLGRNRTLWPQPIERRAMESPHQTTSGPVGRSVGLAGELRACLAETYVIVDAGIMALCFRREAHIGRP